MPQARRIKPRARPKQVRGGNRLPQLPWGLLLVICLSALLLGVLINGAQRGDSEFGAGLRALFEQRAPAVDEDAEIAALIDTRSTEKEFEFYELLRDIEKVMPDDLPDSVPVGPDENTDYYVQAASFRDYQDAEELRAKLALKGFRSITQAREVEGKGTFYRLRLGPYADRRKAKTAKSRLQKLGVRPFVYSVAKAD
ncbi:MAG: SPOR domain-containing protein [Gammaproteobacteria bacterium]|nr:SPOR domain-containing protein [Gammaproteobacteria bacterium]